MLFCFLLFLRQDHKYLAGLEVIVTKSDLELNRRAAPCLIYVVLRLEPRASYMLGKHLTN